MKDFPQRLDDPNDDDLLLNVLLGLLSSTVTNFGLTVVVSGTLVSGQAIDRDVLLEEWLTKLNNASGGGGIGVSRAFRFNIEEYGGAYSVADDLTDVDKPSYVHLRDAVAFSGSTPYTLGLFRARLSEIGGWSLGQLFIPGSDR